MNGPGVISPLKAPLSISSPTHSSADSGHFICPKTDLFVDDDVISLFIAR